MTEAAKHTPTPELALPWSAVANSWQYTTIYDALDGPVCRFDLEDWGVDEDNQDKLEARQAAVVAAIVKAVNAFEAQERLIETLAEALEPFEQFASQVAKDHPGWNHDNFEFRLDPAGLSLPFRWFRRARTALAQARKQP